MTAAARNKNYRLPARADLTPAGRCCVACWNVVPDHDPAHPCVPCCPSCQPKLTALVFSKMNAKLNAKLNVMAAPTR